MQDADDEGEMGVVLEFGVINGYKSIMVSSVVSTSNSCKGSESDSCEW